MKESSFFAALPAAIYIFTNFMRNIDSGETRALEAIRTHI